MSSITAQDYGNLGKGKMKREKAPDKVSYYDLLEALRFQLAVNPAAEKLSTVNLMRSLAMKQSLVEQQLADQWIVYYTYTTDSDDSHADA